MLIPKAKLAFAWWPLRIVCFVLAFYLAVGLIAAVTLFEFGRNAEEQVADVAAGLTEIVGIILVPVLLVGIIAVPFHRWLMRKIVGRPSSALTPDNDD
jgi:formate hydrogenlyase subunit 3/multisubunit Na+/H+ antiporter MnhD subunit